jgi:HK97 family phage portal protein
MGVVTNLKAAVSALRGYKLTDETFIQRVSGGAVTNSGEFVSVDRSLQLATVWSCVRLISQTIATLPLPVYKGRMAGAKPAIDHPLYRILHDRPNADMTAVNFRVAMVSSLLLWGNAYVAILRSGRTIVGLTPMRPDRVNIQLRSDGSRVYSYSFNGYVEELEEDQVLHIKGFSLDGYYGISPISVARENLGAALAVEHASSSFFANGMRPGGVVKVPATKNSTGFLTAEQRVQAEEMLSTFKGSLNSGKWPVLEGGWELTPLVMPPHDAEMLATRQFDVEVLCRWFDVPPIMIGHMGGSTTLGSSTEQVMTHFYKTCIRYHLLNIEAAINTQLFTEAEIQAGYYAEHNIEGLLRADSAARFAIYSTATQNGLMTRNEARALENLPPVEGGDVLTIQSALVDLKNVDKPPEPAPNGLLPGQQRQTQPQNGQSQPIPETRQ